jgi:hypothetical protein
MLLGFLLASTQIGFLFLEPQPDTSHAVQASQMTELSQLSFVGLFCVYFSYGLLIFLGHANEWIDKILGRPRGQVRKTRKVRPSFLSHRIPYQYRYT